MFKLDKLIDTKEKQFENIYDIFKAFSVFILFKSINEVSIPENIKEKSSILLVGKSSKVIFVN